jgi:hypothetical protein
MKEIWVAHSRYNDHICYQDVANGHVPNRHKLVLQQYMDENLQAGEPVPHDANIDCRKDLVLLRKSVIETTVDNETAAIPYPAPDELAHGISLVTINKEMPITPYIMARYPKEVTEANIRALVAGMFPGYVTEAIAPAKYAYRSQDTLCGSVSSNEADFIIYTASVTDDTPGGAIAVFSEGIVVQRRHMIGRINRLHAS